MNLYVTPAQHLAGIDAALALLPTKQRAHTAEVTAAQAMFATVDAYPKPYTAGQIAGQLGAATPDTFADTVADLAVEQARRQLVQDARPYGLAGALTERFNRALHAGIDEYARRLAPVAEQAARQLADAARQLPAGPAAFDAQRAIADNYVDAHRTALTATAVLRATASVWNPHMLEHQPPSIDLVELVAVPDDLEPLRYPFDRTEPMNPPHIVGHVTSARTLGDLWMSNPNEALLEVAAGRHDGYTITMPTSRAELDRRRRLYTNAHLYVSVKRSAETV